MTVIIILIAINVCFCIKRCGNKLVNWLPVLLLAILGLWATIVYFDVSSECGSIQILIQQHLLGRFGVNNEEQIEKLISYLASTSELLLFVYFLGVIIYEKVKEKTVRCRDLTAAFVTIVCLGYCSYLTFFGLIITRVTVVGGVEFVYKLIF